MIKYMLMGIWEMNFSCPPSQKITFIKQSLFYCVIRSYGVYLFWDKLVKEAL